MEASDSKKSFQQAIGVQQTPPKAGWHPPESADRHAPPHGEDGIITRTVYPKVPPRVEYALSELGETMRPVILSMENWGKSYKEQLGQIEGPSPD